MVASNRSTCFFRWPGEIPDWGYDNFFAGAWFPEGTARVEVGPLPDGVAAVSGANWAILSARSPVHPSRPGLVHQRGEEAVAFRGYVFPRLHSYSASREICAHWLDGGRPPYNGVFAAAVVGDKGRSCSLVADFLGIGPLFYRRAGDGVLFSTNPRYLALDGDSPDRLAWRHFMHVGYVQANRTLTAGVEAVPAGAVVRFDCRGVKHHQWFDFSALPTGEVEAQPADLAVLEELFRQAVSRCLALDVGEVVLPLSGGFDSRRLLGALLHAGASFRAVSSPVLKNSRGNIDASVARLVAETVGRGLRVVDAVDGAFFVRAERIRMAVFDGHCLEHGWAVPLMREASSAPTLWLDGIAGDVLGRPVGWRNHAPEPLEPGLPQNERADVIAAHVATRLMEDVLDRRSWPSLDELREDLGDYFARFQPRNNLSEITFLLQRTRRAIGLGTQQLAPPGCVVACPYLDLDYFNRILRYTPASKVALWIQRSSLREWYPQLYRLPSTRDFLLDPLPGYRQLERNRCWEWVRELGKELSRNGHSAHSTASLLARPRRLVLHGARVNATIAQRAGWYLVPLMELAVREASRVPCWSLA